MLILTPDEVTACGVEQPGRLPTLGVAYQGRAFYPENSVYLSHDAALDRCRTLLDADPKTKTQAIILKEEAGYSIYLHNPIVKTLSLSEALNAICAQMRSTEGFVSDRRWRLRVFKASFVGSEAVNWLVENLRLSRSEAIAIGQRCLDLGIFRHVLDEQPFADSDFFYRFSADGEPEKRLGTTAPLASGEVVFRGIRGTIEGSSPS